MNKILSYILLFSIALSGCGPSASQKAFECLDKICDGDARPDHNKATEAAIKVGGRWFIGPSEYFTSGINTTGFEWWRSKALSRKEPRPKEAQNLALNGQSHLISVPIWLSSSKSSSGPHGYKLILLAEENGWILERKTLRDGLDLITMKNGVGPSGYSIDKFNYYVATKEREPEGYPPVLACEHNHPADNGTTGFIFKPGIVVGLRVNQKNCTDWPEIYNEVIRILKLLKEV